MVKCYQVFYWIKKNRKEYLNHMYISAKNAKEACKKCKEEVKQQTGRNAFRASTKPYSKEELDLYRSTSYYVVD